MARQCLFAVTRQTGFLAAALNSLHAFAAIAVFIIVIYAFRVIKGWYSLWRREAPW